jgi:hypothetical protein
MTTLLTEVGGGRCVGSIRKETPMPKFAVEVQYLLPVWTCVIVEAENADAGQKAVMFDESSHTWDQQVEDYENSRASTIEGWREIPDDYDAEISRPPPRRGSGTSSTS